MKGQALLFILLLFQFSCSGIQNKNSKEIELYPLGKLEGLSGLFLDSENQEEWIFWTHTDRGPNTNEIIEKGQMKRPFVRPDFRPYWTKFSLNKKSQEIKILNQVELSLTGLPNKNQDELPVDLTGKVLKRDPMGIDPESICMDEEFVWMGEEYGPSILKFTKEGKFLKRYGPSEFPEKIKNRKLNRGFEGLACAGNKIYAILQSPIPADGNKILIIEFNPKTEKTEREFYYPLDSLDADKIGDMSFKDNHFYVIEQNSKTGKESFHKIFKFNLNNTDEKGLLVKELVVDLVEVGFGFADKIEGLAILDNHHLAIVNDNDFGLSGKIDKSNKPSIDRDKKTVLGIVNY